MTKVLPLGTSTLQQTFVPVPSSIPLKDTVTFTATQDPPTPEGAGLWIELWTLSSNEFYNQLCYAQIEVRSGFEGPVFSVVSQTKGYCGMCMSKSTNYTLSRPAPGTVIQEVDLIQDCN